MSPNYQGGKQPPRAFLFVSKPLGRTVKREPLVTVASITALVAALIGLLVAFGVNLTGTQQTAILTAASVLAPLAVAALVRSKVTPV